MAPSVNAVSMIWPSTRDLMATVLRAWMVPMVSILIGIVRLLTVATRTGVGGLPPLPAGLLAPDEPEKA